LKAWRQQPLYADRRDQAEQPVPGSVEEELLGYLEPRPPSKPNAARRGATVIRHRPWRSLRSCRPPV